MAYSALQRKGRKIGRLSFGPKIQSLPRSNEHKLKAAIERWRCRTAAIASDHRLTAAALVLIGFLLALNLIFRFPDLGAVVGQYIQ
jgi:hypothetical protein